MDDGIKTVMGPVQNRRPPLKTITGDIVLDRWVEHSELYSRQYVVTTIALDAIERLSVMEDLNNYREA